MIKRLWFISWFLLVVGCSPVAKTLQVDHSSSLVTSSSTRGEEDLLQVIQKRDSTLIEKSSRDTSTREITVVQIVEVFDTTSKEIHGTQPLYSRTTTIYNANRTSSNKTQESYQEHSFKSDSSRQSLRKSDTLSLNSEQISSECSKEKKGNSPLQKLLIRLGLACIIALVLMVLYYLYKPRLNTIVTIFKNILNR